jgi:hypothetical protein
MSERKKQIAFTFEKSSVKDLNNGEGMYSIEDMKIFSENTDSIVWIKGYAIIEKGEMRRMC